MAVKIKLARIGKIREPFYRVVIADARTRRNGRAIELVGKYQPKLEPSLIEIDSERVQHWLGVGAQPTEAVVALLKVTGDWQKFKGLPGAEGTLKPQPEKVDKRARYEAALASLGTDEAAGATTAKKRAPKKAEKVADEVAEAPVEVVEEVAETAEESPAVEIAEAADAASDADES